MERSEEAATWNNAPAAIESIIASLGPVVKETWYEVDVTPAVSGDGLLSFRISSTSEDQAQYSSKEGTFSPQLTVVVNPPDTTPPSKPTSLTADAVIGNWVDLNWTSSTDDIGVVGYKILRDGVQIATSSSTSYSDTTVQPDTSYSYYLVAFDASNNDSPQSDIVTVTPQIYTFSPIADTYVSEENPTTNYGASPLRTDGSPIKTSYLRFNVQGVGVVQSAILRIFAETDNSIGFDVRGVSDNTWSESIITYADAPPFGGILGSSGIIIGGNWYNIDVSSSIPPGNGLVSFALTSTSTRATRYSSSNGTNPPQLVVQYTLPPSI